MKLFLPALLGAVLLVSTASGEHAFIWNYDDEDVFYCDEAGEIVDCAYWIEETLSYNGHTYETDTLLPADLSTYDAVFISTGWYRC